MFQAKKKPKPAGKPKITQKYVEDNTNVSSIISQPIEPSIPRVKTVQTFPFKNRSSLSSQVVRNRQYSFGSVYSQASRFAVGVSSSTNISSSGSGSVEVLISEIDNPIEENIQTPENFFRLGEIREDQSEDNEEQIINTIIQNRTLSTLRSSHEEDLLNKSMKEVQNFRNNEKKNQDIKKFEVRLKVLQAVKFGKSLHRHHKTYN